MVEEELVPFSVPFMLSKVVEDSAWLPGQVIAVEQIGEVRSSGGTGFASVLLDLLDRDDLSGNYAESSTTYSSMKGTENGTSSSSTISVGAYVSFEQEFSVFGVKIGSVERSRLTSGFIYETDTSSLRRSSPTETTSGEDRVAFYSIPMKLRVRLTVPDGTEQVSTKVTSTVSIARVGLIDLSDYENIAEDYGVLPRHFRPVC